MCKEPLVNWFNRVRVQVFYEVSSDLLPVSFTDPLLTPFKYPLEYEAVPSSTVVNTDYFIPNSHLYQPLMSRGVFSTSASMVRAIFSWYKFLLHMSHERKNSGKIAVVPLRSSPLKLSCRGFLKLAGVFEKKADVENTVLGDEEALFQVFMISFLFLILIVYRNKTDNWLTSANGVKYVSLFVNARPSISVDFIAFFSSKNSMDIGTYNVH